MNQSCVVRVEQRIQSQSQKYYSSNATNQKSSRLNIICFHQGSIIISCIIYLDFQK